MQFKIIDSFYVNGSDANKPKAGWWFVLEGRFSDGCIDIPKIGGEVQIISPSGDRLCTRLCSFEIRHEVAACQFEINRGDVLRLSTVIIE